MMNTLCLLKLNCVVYSRTIRRDPYIHSEPALIPGADPGAQAAHAHAHPRTRAPPHTSSYVHARTPMHTHLQKSLKFEIFKIGN
jgi:hypothetical protein